MSSWEVLPDGRHAQTMRLQLKAGSGAKLLKFSLRRGLPNLTVPFLKKLCKRQGIPMPQAATEVTLMRAIAVALLGDEFSDALLREILLARNRARNALKASRVPASVYYIYICSRVKFLFSPFHLGTNVRAHKPLLPGIQCFRPESP